MKLTIKILIFLLITSLIGGAIYFLKPNDERQTEGCKETPELKDKAVRMVTKVIDGDTVLIEGGYSVRLLGIDADERNKPCYNTAKERLEELVLNKEVVLESGNDDLDQWCRYLRYISLNDTNIGLEMVRNGYAVARTSNEGSKYQSEIALVEKNAIDNKIGCKWGGAGATEPVNRDKTYQWSKLTSELIDLKVIESCSADESYRKEVIVEGWVADVYQSKTNTIFLNFEQTYPNQCFVGVIFSSDQDQFTKDPEEVYSNQMIRIRGTIEEYRGKPEIILKSSDQIEIGVEGL